MNRPETAFSYSQATFILKTEQLDRINVTVSANALEK